MLPFAVLQVVEGKGHNKEVDWWSCGILLYEMLCGQPPFRGKGRNQLQSQILAAKPKYPKFLSSEALSLLKGFLARDPSKRLGVGPTGSADIKAHPFFKKISWAKLDRREVPSTFKPVVKNSLSVENFDKMWTEQPALDSPCSSPIQIRRTNSKHAMAGSKAAAGGSRQDGGDDHDDNGGAGLSHSIGGTAYPMTPERNPFHGFSYVAPGFMATGLLSTSSTGKRLEGLKMMSPTKSASTAIN